MGLGNGSEKSGTPCLLSHRPHRRQTIWRKFASANKRLLKRECKNAIGPAMHRTYRFSSSVPNIEWQRFSIETSLLDLFVTKGFACMETRFTFVQLGLEREETVQLAVDISVSKIVSCILWHRSLLTCATFVSIHDLCERNSQHCIRRNPRYSTPVLKYYRL